MFLGFFSFKAAYTAAKGDLNALNTQLYQFGILPNKKVTVQPCKFTPNRYVFFDWGKPKNPALERGKAYDIEALIKAYHPANGDKQKQILKDLGFWGAQKSSTIATNTASKNTASAQNLTVRASVAQPPIQNAPNPTANPKKQPTYKTALWISQIGAVLLAYFAQKTGCGDVDFLTKHGVTPVKPQYCKYQYLASARDLIMMRKAYPIDPNDPRGYRVGDWSKAPETSYIFGYELLPKTPKQTDVLIFCEGQTDAICGNFHLNAHGFYFVTVGSAINGRLSDADASNLKSLFSNIFVLWDNDKEGENSKDFAEKHGFGWIDAKAFFGDNLKDICELWDVLLGAVLELNAPNPEKSARELFIYHFKENAKKRVLQSTIPTILGDRFSIGVESAYIHKFDQYLGENTSLNAVLEFVQNNPRLMIQSPAGTGKSTIIQQLVTALNVGIGSTYETITVIVPTTSIGLQLFESFNSKGVSCTYFDGKNKSENNGAKLWITTYDSAEKFRLDYWLNTYLIIDEFHQIANDYSYRASAMQTVWRVLKNPLQSAVLLSATPNYLLCSNLTKGFNFTPLLCYPQTTNRINTRSFEYDENIRHAVEHVLRNKPNRKGCILLKYNDLTTLLGWKEYLVNLGYTVDIFCSKSAKYKENNDNYNSVLNFGRLANKVDFILTTTLLEAGVSLKFPVSLVCAFDDCGSWARNIQLATRPRFDHFCERKYPKNKNTQKLKRAQKPTFTAKDFKINKVVDFWMFFSSKRGATAKDNTLTKSTQDLTATQIFTKHYSIAEGLASTHLQPNGVVESIADAVSVSTYKQKFIYQPEKGSEFAVNVPAILGNIYDLETMGSTVSQVLERIKAFDPRFNIQPLEQLNIPQIPFLSDWFRAIKSEKEARKIAFISLLQTTDPHQIRCTLLASFAGSKDKEKRKELSAYLNEPLTKTQQIAGREFREANPYPFEARGKVDFCLQVFDLLKGTNPKTSKPYAFADAVEKVASTKKREVIRETDTQKFKRIARIYKSQPASLSEKDTTLIIELKGVHKKFTKIQDNQQTGKLAPQNLEYFAEKLNECIPKLNKPFSPKTALDYLATFYDIQRIRKKIGAKRIYLYKILGVKKSN